MDMTYQTGIQWVVQRNLTNHHDLHALENACGKLGIDFVGIDIIPFSNELPAFDRAKKSLFYGSTTFNQLAYEDAELKAGVFFDPVAFSMDRQMAVWGTYMLNNGARVTTFDELMAADFDPEKLLFIRPDDDGKSFAGEVLTFAEFRKWFEGLRQVENADVSGASKIVVGEPFNLGREWRLWCVGGRVVAASQYRNRFELAKERGCPKEVVDFAEARCLTFTPHPIFVMDVCESAGELYIVECNCMNAAGFYAADIGTIVEHVSAKARNLSL